MALAGKYALIAGGAGTVGSGCVEGFLKAGATVLVPSRRLQKLQAFKERLGSPENLHVVEADVGDEEGVKAALKYIDDKFGGQLDHLVTSLGTGIWQNPVIGSEPLATFTQQVQDMCGSHYVAANAFLPKLLDRPGSSYTIVTGSLGGAYQPGAGFVTIAASALWGLSIVIRGETANRAVRVNELRISTWVTPEKENRLQIGDILAGLASEKGAQTKGQVLPGSESGLSDLLKQYKL